MIRAAPYIGKRGAPRGRLLAGYARLLLAALVLLAQQSALSHFLVHAPSAHHAAAERAGPDSDPQVKPLCDLHTVLDGMLGLPSRWAETVFPEAPRSAPAHESAVAAVAWRALPPGATGPPALL